MKAGPFEIETNDLVYIPSDDTFLLAENLDTYLQMTLSF